MIKGAFNLERQNERSNNYTVKNDEGNVIGIEKEWQIKDHMQNIIDAEEAYQNGEMTAEQKVAHEAELAKLGLEHNADNELIAPHDNGKGYTVKESLGYSEETKDGITTQRNQDNQVTARSYTDNEGNRIRETDFNGKGEFATKTIIDSNGVEKVQSFSGGELNKEVITPDSRHPENTITKEFSGDTVTKIEMKVNDETTTTYNPTDENNKITVKTEGGAVTSFEKGDKTYYPDEKGKVDKITTKIDDNYYKEETKEGVSYYKKTETENGYEKMTPEEIRDNDKIKAFQVQDAQNRNSDKVVGANFDKVFNNEAKGTGMDKGSIKTVVNMPVKVGGRD